jgi:hypothetical protein
VRNARLVSHPNVCRVFDIGEVEGQHFLTMEYVDGEDLASLLRRIGRLPPDKALETAHQICAGLAAAHDCGLLHRDLKPANIMLDGRGRVRITDFGLALSFEDAMKRLEAAGAPAYMAPEQIEKGQVSVHSDIYSLGLVLYELFTGSLPYRATGRLEWRRVHQDSSPKAPSLIVKEIDPAIEKAILRCLQKDIGLRPSSARQVEAMLPGGDPLARAIAAGETPSPEMVAAAGVEDVLQPRTAWLLILGTLLALSAVVILAPYGSELGLAPIEKSPEELQIRAKDIARNLGYTNPGVDSGSGFVREIEYSKYLSSREPSTQWYRKLSATGFGPVRFWYRQSPQLLVPLNGDLVDDDYGVKENDPPLDVSGMVTVSLSSQGELLGFRAVPPQIDESSVPSPRVDWHLLFAAAGLDEGRFTVAAPKWVPTLPFDERKEWDNSSAREPSTTIHVAAAAYRGRPVYFDLMGPWTRPIRMESSRISLGEIVSDATRALSVLAVIVVTVIFARHNIRLGRGDRKGAFQLFVFLCSAKFLLWVFWGHFVADLPSEFTMFVRALSESVGFGA